MSGEILSYVAIGISVLGVVHHYIAVNVVLERRLSTLETKVEIPWKLIEQKALTILHHPDRRLLDSYLDEYRSGEITKERVQEMAMLLDVLTRDPTVSADDRWAGTMMLAAVAQRYGVVICE